jgi:hypothetical protein
MPNCSEILYNPAALNKIIHAACMVCSGSKHLHGDWRQQASRHPLRTQFG